MAVVLSYPMDHLVLLVRLARDEFVWMESAPALNLALHVMMIVGTLYVASRMRTMMTLQTLRRWTAGVQRRYWADVCPGTVPDGEPCTRNVDCMVDWRLWYYLPTDRSFPASQTTQPLMYWDVV